MLTKTEIVRGWPHSTLRYTQLKRGGSVAQVDGPVSYEKPSLNYKRSRFSKISSLFADSKGV